jgi:glyoxylase-like metal-dependent hydrolase (beta-lactamase superfamily II)
MLDSEERLLVVPFKHGPFWNFSYLVACPRTKQALIVDPAWGSETMLARANELSLDVTTVVLTHGHNDHSHGVTAIVDRLGARVVAHEAEAAEIRRTYRGPIDTVRDDAELPLGRTSARLLHTPGHTPGSLSLLAGGELFTGDALHVGAIGRAGAEPGALGHLWRTVTVTFDKLPDETVVRPGHDAGPTPHSTLGLERARLPAMSARSLDAFESLLRR